MLEKMSEYYIGMLKDESRLEGWADFVAMPHNTEELVQALEAAAARELQVTVQGAATGVVGGGVSQGGVLLSLQKMNQILGFREDDGNGFLRMQAGVTFREVGEYLAKQRGNSLFFPPNPTEKNATLGGAFACNSAGMNVMYYGAVSKWVSGIVWLLPDGRRWEIRRGEFVFDDNGCMLPDGSFLEAGQLRLADSPRILAQYPQSGMDLIDFLAGSEGRLGVLAELELRLSPVCKENWGILFFLEQSGSGIAFGNAVCSLKVDNSGGCYISGCEYFDEGALSLLGAGRRQLSNLARMPELSISAEEAVFVTISGSDEILVEKRLLEILEIFTGYGGKEENAWAASSLRELEKFQALHHGVFELVNLELDMVRKVSGDVVKCALDACVPPDGLEDFVSLCKMQAREADIPIYCVARVPVGQLHINLVPRKAADLGQSKRLMDAWSVAVLETGGLLATENGVGKNKRKQIFEYLNDEQREYYMKLEQHFDGQRRMQNGFSRRLE